jgi:hypothetical protein
VQGASGAAWGLVDDEVAVGFVAPEEPQPEAAAEPMTRIANTNARVLLTTAAGKLTPFDIDSLAIMFLWLN